MKVKEFLPILSLINNSDKGEYVIEYSLKNNLFYTHANITDIIRNCKCYPADKMVIISNKLESNYNNADRVRKLYNILSSPEIGEDFDIVFGHYIVTGKSISTLITADDYKLVLDDMSTIAIKFDIKYRYLNI